VKSLVSITTASIRIASIAIALGFVASTAADAAAPASAPAGTTGQCKDGTFTSAAAKKGACHGHQGVKEWYAAESASTSSTSKSDTAATSSSKKKHADASTAAASAPTPATRPADATGLCKDGTYYTGENKKGACHGHKGVKDWYGASTTSKTTAASPSATPAPATMPAQTFPKPTPTTMPNANTPTTGTQTGSKATLPGGTSPTPAAGGGTGKVWVNTSTKVYHCSGDRYYGTTKQGEYMSEADAKAKGDRPAHGKDCSS
jgi:hypothetical protein